MHVLVIAQLFPPDMGGGSTRANNVVNGLLSLGCRVTVVTAFPHYPIGNIPRAYRHKLLRIEDRGKLRVIRTWGPPLASKGIANRFVLFVSFILSSLFAFPLVMKIDVVWAANPNIFSVFPALFYSRIKACPIVQNVDDLWPEETYELGMLKSQLLRRLAEYVSKFTYSVSTAITPISPAYRDVIIKKYEVNPEKLHVISAGVDLDRFAMKKSRVKRKEHDGKFKVLYIGALSLAYDFNYVLKATKLLSSESRIKFVIQGEGELGSMLKFKVKEMKLSNVDVVLKIVSRDEVAKILSTADVLLLPLSSLGSIEMGMGSIEIGIPSKLYEYQASGKPIICCSKGQPAKYVSRTRSGIVVAPGDNEGLAKAILCLYQRKDLAKSLGKSGKEYVEKNLSYKKIGLEMEKVFRGIQYRKHTKGMKDERRMCRNISNSKKS